MALAALVAACAEAQGAPGGYRGTLTLARDGAGEVFSAAAIIDVDLATNAVTARFDGFDPQRTAAGETAYITRLGEAYVGDAGVVVADRRGVPGAPLFVCRMFSHTSNRVCHTPKLSPDAKLVAFGIADGGGKLCQTPYGLFFGDYVVVRDRAGAELARHEGFHSPEWLPDGRLLMLGSACRGAGVWIAPRAQDEPARVDRGEVATPARLPTVSPDGRKLALVWNKQLWTMTLDGRAELEQVTRFEKPVAAATWSPDGQAMALLLWDVALPVRALVLARPGSPAPPEVRPLAFYPYGPLSWR
jgi:hypothetical protein